jgi:hypothetical protein
LYQAWLTNGHSRYAALHRNILDGKNKPNSGRPSMTPAPILKQEDIVHGTYITYGKNSICKQKKEKKKKRQSRQRFHHNDQPDNATLGTKKPEPNIHLPLPTSV